MVSAILLDRSARRASSTLHFQQRFGRHAHPSCSTSITTSPSISLSTNAFDAQRREIDFSASGPAIRSRQNVIERAVILWKSLPSRRRPTPRYDGVLPRRGASSCHGVPPRRSQNQLISPIASSQLSCTDLDQRKAWVMADLLDESSLDNPIGGVTAGQSPLGQILSRLEPAQNESCLFFQ
jgi:hypothetical protein